MFPRSQIFEAGFCPNAGLDSRILHKSPFPPAVLCLSHKGTVVGRSHWGEHLCYCCLKLPGISGIMFLTDPYGLPVALWLCSHLRFVWGATIYLIHSGGTSLTIGIEKVLVAMVGSLHSYLMCVVEVWSPIDHYSLVDASEVTEKVVPWWGCFLLLLLLSKSGQEQLIQTSEVSELHLSASFQSLFYTKWHVFIMQAGVSDHTVLILHKELSLFQSSSGIDIWEPLNLHKLFTRMNTYLWYCLTMMLLGTAQSHWSEWSGRSHDNKHDCCLHCVINSTCENWITRGFR